MKLSRRQLFRLILALAVGSLLVFWQKSEGEKLVVYCAHDAVFADEILRDFTKETGIPLAVKYDTEATKSLGLAEQIIREGDQPRCDVFWNNELLGMADLAERGLLQPFQSEGWRRRPDKYRDTQARWTGFAARLRMVIRNTTKPATEDLAQWAVAKPLYGTTLTHYAALWSRWGPEKLKAWHGESRKAGIREVNGNGPVKDIVAAGTCAMGWTDTDDYFDALDAGAPVTGEPVALEDGSTICIPNTVAIIRGTKREADARKLVEFLLSKETELALARSKSRQIPLGPIEGEELPEQVRALVPAVEKGISLTGLLPARNACLEWLKGEYTR